tara:strand:+ start:442 stop:1059 length:618 start_codon:yes stop_codon:yes gene_type:complete
MSRGLSTDVKNLLASGSFAMAHLVKLELNSTYYYTDFATDIIDSGDTYYANGFLRGISPVSEKAKLGIGALQISLSAVNQTIVSDVLNNGHLHRQVTIKRAVLNSSNTLVGSFTIYLGYIEKMSISDSNSSSTLNFSVANHWSDFNRINGRRTNNASQQHYFNGDKSFEFCSQAGKQLVWGDLGIQQINEAPAPRYNPRMQPRGR